MNNYDIKVYIAGAYSADNVIDVLKNIGRGEKMAAKVFAEGFSPFCPWSDGIFITHNPKAHFEVEMFYKYSIAWLKVSDCMLLVSGWEKSKGTNKEIIIAEQKLKIPVFDTIDELKDYYKK
jgi:hypothetical protein